VLYGSTQHRAPTRVWLDPTGIFVSVVLIYPARPSAAVCQAALPQHWIDSAPNIAERASRRAALDRLAVDRDGHKVMDGPAVLDLIRRWDRRFEWVPGERGDRGVLVHNPRAMLVEESETLRRLLVP